MLPGLLQGQEKMSKTDSSSSIFMEDEEVGENYICNLLRVWDCIFSGWSNFSAFFQAEVNLKIKKAYCPPQIVEGNPCLEYLNYIIFPWFKEFTVERKAENGGNK